MKFRQYYVSVKRLESLKKEAEKVERIEAQIQNLYIQLQDIKEKNSDLRYLSSNSTTELTEDQRYELQEYYSKIMYSKDR